MERRPARENQNDKRERLLKLLSVCVKEDQVDPHNLDDYVVQDLYQRYPEAFVSGEEESYAA